MRTFFRPGLNGSSYLGWGICAKGTPGPGCGLRALAPRITNRAARRATEGQEPRESYAEQTRSGGTRHENHQGRSARGGTSRVWPPERLALLSCRTASPSTCTRSSMPSDINTSSRASAAGIARRLIGANFAACFGLNGRLTGILTM
jgi:hypothetical protein